MSTRKRALAPASSAQRSQPKLQRIGSVKNQAMDASENIVTPKTCLTLQDFQRVFREELDTAVGKFESIVNGLNESWKHSLEEFEIRVEALEHAQVHSAFLGRAHTKYGEMKNMRNLQLQFRTNLVLPLYTGRKLEGENRDAIHVALIDANTGDVVSSGPESTIKLDAFVLDGDFNKDDNDDWTQEEFENNVVKGRERKGRLLAGNCRVILKEGVGVLGDLIFNDNSSWIPSQKFRIGLKVASGYCENARIREAITEAFRVKEHRGESSEKKHPPRPDDELWRLEKIAKDGKPLHRLNDAGIYKVGDFLLQLSRDPENLRNILRMKEKHWKILVDHAKTCTPSGKLYVYYQDDTRNHGVVLENTGRLSGLIENGVYFASHRLSTTQKGYADSMEKKAWDNWNRLEEFHGEDSFASIQDKHSTSFPSGFNGGRSENLNPVEHNFPQLIWATAVAGEAPIHFVQSMSEGHKGITAAGLPIQSQNISRQGLPKQSQNISLQTTIQLAGPPYLSLFNAIGVNSPSEGHLWMDILVISIPDDERNCGSSFVGGHTSITAVGVPIQLQNISFQFLPKQSQNISLQTTVQLAGPPCLSPSSFNAISVNSPSEADLLVDNYLIYISDDERNSGTSFIGTVDNANNCMEDSKANGKAIVWTKASNISSLPAMRWGLFLQKRAAPRAALKIVELDGQN